MNLFSADNHVVFILSRLKNYVFIHITLTFNVVIVFAQQPLYGYGSTDPMPFRPIKESELFFHEDKEINLPELATDNKVFSSAGKTTVKGNSQF